MDERTLARYLSKIDVQPNGCHLWTGKPNEHNYGYFWFEGKSRLVHRFTHQQFIGPIPDGFEVDHKCHSDDPDCPGGNDDPHRLCVRLDHLEAVPPLENVMRSNGHAARNAAKTHCDNGHALEGDNLYVYPNGARMCRTCQAQHVKGWAEANRRKGMGKGGHQRIKTHCPEGHQYTEENTYISTTGGRNCRECGRKRNREAQRQRRKAAKAAKQTE